MQEDRLVVSIVDEKGSRQFSLPRNVTKLAIIGAFVVAGLFSLSFVAMYFLMHQVNDIAKQKSNAIAQYHSIYQKNALLRNAIRERTDELEVVNSKIDKLEDIVSIKRNITQQPQITKVDLQSISNTHKLLLLSLIPNGDPLKNFTSKHLTAERLHPLRNVSGVDGAMDYIVPKSTPVYATADGVVVLVQNNGKTGLGNVIKLTHSFGFSSVYAHLDTLTINKGDFVQKGQIIGYSGNSGRSNGERLYYEVGFLGNSLNPATYASWNFDNFDAIFQKEDGIDWKNLVWAIEDIAKLQTLRVSSSEKLKRESL